MALVPPNLIHPKSDNPLLNRPSNPRLDIIIRNEPTLTDLWHDFEISVGLWLFSLWRNFCMGLGARKVEHVDYERIAWPIGKSGVYGYTAQEVADGLSIMTGAKQDTTPEQCSFTPINSDGFALVLPVEEQ